MNVDMTSGWVSAIAESITAVVAVLFGAYQLYLATIGKWRQDAEHTEASERENARLKNSAEAIWRRYELLCIEHPHFACPDLSRVDLEKKTFDSDARKFISYEYFVSFLAYACEEIHGVYGHERDWVDSILDELDWHAEYLTSDYFAEYLPTMAAVIRNIILEMKRSGVRRHQM